LSSPNLLLRRGDQLDHVLVLDVAEGPVGFASRWNAAGASGSVGKGVDVAIRVSMLKT
jgi:hypothetical protein